MRPRLPDYEGFLDILAEILAETGGTKLAFRDAGLMESAFARPLQKLSYEGASDAIDLAASLAVGISRNHPLVDGNKRAAAAALVITILINGQRLDASQREVIDIFEALAAGRSDESALVAWVRGRILEDARFIEPPPK